MGGLRPLIVLDTHAWLWWMHDPGRLSHAACEALERAVPERGAWVSSISAWEVAIKVAAGKLTLPMDVGEWLEGARAFPAIHVEPLAAEDAIESTRLPGELHRDPADRVLSAMARRLRVPLVTRDRKLRRYPHVETLW